MKSFTIMMSAWIFGSAVWAGMLLFPFTKSWQNAIGIGMLTNIGFMVWIMLVTRDNQVLYDQALEATERYIKLAECLRKMQATGEKND